MRAPQPSHPSGSPLGGIPIHVDADDDLPDGYVETLAGAVEALRRHDAALAELHGRQSNGVLHAQAACRLAEMDPVLLDLLTRLLDDVASLLVPVLDA